MTSAAPAERLPQHSASPGAMGRIPSGGFGPAPAAPLEVYSGRRERLLARVPDGIVIAAAGPELKKSRDTEIHFRQSSDLFYLTGLREQESVAVLTPVDDEHRFTLFVRRRDPAREVWDGARIGVERAAEMFGATAVYPIEELPTRLPELLKVARTIYYPVGARTDLDRIAAEAVLRARQARQRTGKGPTGVTDLEALTGPMRLIKDAHEIEQMRVAGVISAAAHRAAMAACRPGAGEWEIEAALEARMRALGAAGPSFSSIVGSGPNATTLHYVENERLVADGDLVLVDAGAEWGMYCGDITRTFPASGRFTAAQRAVYDVVLAAEEAGIAAVSPGASVAAVHAAALRVLIGGLLELKLLREASVEEALESGSYKRFYMHQTSHWLGLDVHDVGLYADNGEPSLLQSGMALTIEPGLYIAADAEGVPPEFRGIGVRIEDDVLVLDGGGEILTRDVPVRPEEVEALVGTA